LVAIQSRLLDVHLGDVDKPIWTITNKCVYESAGTWNYMKNKKQEIRWWPLIWFPHTIPKQGFILWLTMLNRLTTGERLVVWGYQGDTMFFFFFFPVRMELRVVITYFSNAILAPVLLSILPWTGMM